MTRIPLPEASNQKQMLGEKLEMATCAGKYGGGSGGLGHGGFLHAGCLRCSPHSPGRTPLGVPSPSHPPAAQQTLDEAGPWACHPAATMPHVTLHTPLGDLTLSEEDGAIVALDWGRGRDQERHAPAARARDQLQDYFDGKPDGIRPAARPPRHRLPAQGLGCALRHPGRADTLLPRHRPAGRLPRAARHRPGQWRATRSPSSFPATGWSARQRLPRRLFGRRGSGYQALPPRPRSAPRPGPTPFSRPPPGRPSDGDASP